MIILLAIPFSCYLSRIICMLVSCCFSHCGKIASVCVNCCCNWYFKMNSSRAPPNFSWVIPNQLAGMAVPKHKENLSFLIDAGIKHLVSLSGETRPYNDCKDFPQLQWTLIAIEEFEAPSLRQIREFIEICKECRKTGMPIGVHCRQGLGRTGVMLASYLIAFQDVTPERALTTIRLLRPWSVETLQQERILFHYHDYLRSK